jgi:hypothetical protein
MLAWANGTYVESRGAAEMVLRPMAAMWFVLAAPVAGCAVALGMGVGRERPWRRAGLTAVLVGFCVLAGANVRVHTRVTDEELIDESAFSWDKRVLSHRDVASVEMTRYWVYSKYGSGPSKGRGLWLRYRDGAEWRSWGDGVGMTQERTLALARVVAERSGQELKYGEGVAGERPGEESAAAGVAFAAFVLIATGLGIWMRWRSKDGG